VALEVAVWVRVDEAVEDDEDVAVAERDVVAVDVCDDVAEDDAVAVLEDVDVAVDVAERVEEAVDVVFAAVKSAKAGETYIPRIPAARIQDVAEVLIGDRPIKIKCTGIRPGEKMHEALISNEEAFRTFIRGDYYVIAPILPEMCSESFDAVISKEYSSGDNVISKDEIRELLSKRKLLIENTLELEGEFLR
jgi:hypothetical protein